MLTQHDEKTIVSIVQKEVRKEVGSAKRELKNDILQFKDDILTEIIKLRDDLAVTMGYRDKIEDHDTRIDELEKHVYSSK